MLTMKIAQPEVDEVKGWLAVGDQSATHQDFRKIRTSYPNTARWILGRSVVQQWISSRVLTTPLLWIHGIPGAGKTILASAIIDECIQKGNAPVTFFYHSKDDLSNNSAIAIIASLINQLLTQHPSILLSPCSIERRSDGHRTLRTFVCAKKLFKRCLDLIRNLFIIIDGLEQCDAVDRSKIFDLLAECIGESDQSDARDFRILIMSRDHPEVGDRFQGLARQIIKISEADVAADISSYIDMELKVMGSKLLPQRSPIGKKLQRSPVGKKRQRPRIARNLCVRLQKSEGMFLYAEALLRGFHSHQQTINAAKDDVLPQELKNMYEKIMSEQRLSPQWDHIRELLSWIVCAKRPLKWKEIQVARSINVEYQIIDYDNQHLRGNIHELCGSLVDISENCVNLVHSTAKVYVTKFMKDVHKPSVECELAVLCLQYLTFPCFDTDCDEEDLLEYALQGHLGFQDYAAAHWFHHVYTFIENGQKFLDEANASEQHLDNLSTALFEFMDRYRDDDWKPITGDPAYHEDDWSSRLSKFKDYCEVFRPYTFYETLLELSDCTANVHQQFQTITTKGITASLSRNRKFLTELPAKLGSKEKATYALYYSN